MTSAEKLTIADLRECRRSGRRIAMMTACDAITGRLAHDGGIDIALVGDGAASVILGHESTVFVTVDEMLILVRATVRAARRPLVLVDLPFASYEVSDAQAVETALRFVKEAHADAVKLEPGRIALRRARAIVEAGVDVMAHIGLSSQQIKEGTFDPLGSRLDDAKALVDDARAFEAAGVFAVLIEAVPGQVAELVTDALEIPTIGVGSGPGCSGQILSVHDIVGLDPRHRPPWIKQYGSLYPDGLAAVKQYVEDIRSGSFPDATHTFTAPEETIASLRSTLEAA